MEELPVNLHDAVLPIPEQMQRHYAGAIAQYQEAIRLHPDHVEAHFKLGTVYYQLGYYEEAIGAWRQTVQLQPDSVYAYINLGIACTELGRWPEALEAFQQANALQPGDADAHFGMGMAYAQLGRYPEAIAAWKQTLRLQPDNADAHYNLGLLYEFLDQEPGNLWQPGQEQSPSPIEASPPVFAAVSSSLPMTGIAAVNASYHAFDVAKAAPESLAPAPSPRSPVADTPSEKALPAPIAPTPVSAAEKETHISREADRISPAAAPAPSRGMPRATLGGTLLFGIALGGLWFYRADNQRHAPVPTTNTASLATAIPHPIPVQRSENPLTRPTTSQTGLSARPNRTQPTGVHAAAPKTSGGVRSSQRSTGVNRTEQTTARNSLSPRRHPHSSATSASHSKRASKPASGSSIDPDFGKSAEKLLDRLP